MASETKSSETPWWEIRLSCSEPDDLAASLVAAGAAGAHISDEHHVTCYLQCSVEQKINFLRQAAQFGGQLLSDLPVEQKNWTENCPELWQELRIGDIEIIPVQTESEVRPSQSTAKHHLRIVPGMGFGTGHHPTTSMIIELLQSERLSQKAPKFALDVGTGSGILAIAIWQLFNIAVTAVDIDPLALDNAATNAQLNQCSQHLAFSTTPATQLTGKFDLIVANIYAEVLHSLRPDFERLLSTNGTLIVSGIMLPLAAKLQQDFEEQAWCTQRRMEIAGWVSFEFRRA